MNTLCPMTLPTRGSLGARGRRGGCAPCRTGGFTLLELRVALVVVTVTAVGVLSCVTAGYAVDRDATETLQAHNFSRRVVEELMAAPFDNLLTYYSYAYMTEEDLRATVRVQQVLPETGPASLVRIQVTVRALDGSQDLVKVVTQRADYSAPASAWATE